jgi:hypothetical protein
MASTTAFDRPAFQQTRSDAGASVLRCLRAAASDTRTAVGSFADTLVAIDGSMHEHLSHHPYVTIATVIGVGYVLGGGVPRRLTRWLGIVAMRFAFEAIARDLGTRLAFNELSSQRRATGDGNLPKED